MYIYEVTFSCYMASSYYVYIKADTRKEAIDTAKDIWYHNHFDRMDGIRASRVKDVSVVKDLNTFKKIGY